MKKVIKLLLIFILFPFLLGIINVNARETKTIRVGWFESAFNKTDEFGRRSGYCYDYEQKLSVYTGWEYEYVSGSWPDLFKMLIDGKIDMLGDVSYTEDRASLMNFSSLPMGTEDYFLYKSTQNKDISINDYNTFNGKKVGINKGSIMVDLFKKWETANNIEAEIIELNNTVSEGLALLNRGGIDLYVEIDGALKTEDAVPLYKIGSSDFYFATKKDGDELIEELNVAMNKILTEDAYFNQKLHEKYFISSGINLYLNDEELKYMNEHKKIKIGYQDNYLAFCAKDSNGNLTGALKDYLNMASDALKNAHIEFEAIAYPSATKAIEALKNGEVDCMFPANLSVYDGEVEGLFMTNPFMRTEINAVIKESEQKNFFKKERVAVAVNAGNTNYDMFLVDNFPNWRSVYFENTDECLKGISEGKADCLLISNYRYNNISQACNKYNLISLSTGVEIDYCFAVKRTDSILYSILNKIISEVPESSVNTSLSYYYTEDAKTTFGDFLSDNLGIIMVVLAIIALLFLFLILRNVMTEKKYKSRQSLIKATEFDNKTALYNKTYFIEYANRLYKDKTDQKKDMIAINVERFHFVNNLNGRKFGDQVLREISDEIKLFIKDKNGIACHLEADRFVIYANQIDNYNDFIDKLQSRIDILSINASIRIKMGVMPYKEGLNPTQQMEQAILASNLALNEFKENLVVFDQKMSEKESFEQRLLNDLRSSIENKEFQVYFQPKFDITEEEPKLVGVEALIRWKHKDLGFIFPNEFIPLFEKNGQIGLLDKYVRAESVKYIASWKEKYGFILPVSVNISRIEILDQTFEDQLELLLEEYNLPNNALNLEVTESAYIDDADHFIKVITNLRKAGFKIEMDDFGTGYSSLNMLSLMPIDILKMDRGFIFDIETNEKNVHFVELILGIARNLHVPVIAEGVETIEQLKILKNLGCDIIQGYYFSKPIPAIEFEEKFLKK